VGKEGAEAPKKRREMKGDGLGKKKKKLETTIGWAVGRRDKTKRGKEEEREKQKL